MASSTEEQNVQTSPLLRLPTELITSIILHLPAFSLAPLSEACRRLYHVVHTDAQWKERVLGYQIPQTIKAPTPFKSWEDCFLGHYPYWFLPKHRIWFADSTEDDHGYAGQMIVTQYDYRTGNIMGYALTGEKGDIRTHSWPEKPHVSIHDFHPRIRLNLEHPALRIRPRPGALLERYDRRTEAEPRGLASQRSAQSDFNQLHRIGKDVMLARAIPEDLQHDSMRLWPPKRIPAIERVRQLSPSLWSSLQLSRRDSPSELKGTSFERPTAHVDVCESAFRLRKNLIGHPARVYDMLRYGSESRDPDRRVHCGVTTYCTLPEDSYRPSKERPYQGIWVGDYARHGCEFLLIRQKITKKEKRKSEPVGPRLDTLFRGGNPVSQEEALLNAEPVQEEIQEDDDPNFPFADGHDSEYPPLEDGEEIGETGRLEAVKLTGDINVPRGEFTFVAENIGKSGVRYVGSTAEFEGKRVVSSWGHIAGRGFADDIFIQADLILVSHDCLAQYWKDFGHVAFYRRISIDNFLDPDNADFVQQL